MATKKQSVLLGLRDKLEGSFKNMLDDMFNKFKTKQGLFFGTNKTYTALDGYADDPSKRGIVKVGSTVDEQLQWFKEHTADYLTTVLSIEKTNSSGIKADLVVDDERWGTYSVLELLRLKSILDGKLSGTIQEIPIRPESIFWTKTENPVYEGRSIFEDKLDEGYSKTTLKRTVVVEDPYVKEAPERPPVTQSIDTLVNVGKYTSQNYSGAYSNFQRAILEVRYNRVRTAVIEALETANNIESETSDLGDKFLEYMF